MRSPRTSKSRSNSNSNQIVLVKGDFPLPLNSYDPRSPASLSLRKSPRFGSSSKDSDNVTPKSRSKEVSVDPKWLRKSPRFALSRESVKSRNVSSRATKVQFLVDRNSLRRSPRLGPSPGEAKSTTNGLRKSPRFVPSDSNRKVSEIPAIVDSESLRRSPRLVSTNEEPKLPALVDPNSLRRSPRLVPSDDEPKSNDSTKRTVKTPALVDPNTLRRSPRLGPSHEEQKPSEKSQSTKRASKTLALVEPSCLRRSSRLGPSSEDTRPSDSTPLRREIQALVDPNSHRRSTRLGPKLTESNVGKKEASMAQRHGSSEFEKVRKDSAIGESSRRNPPRFAPVDYRDDKDSDVDKSRRSSAQNLASMIKKYADTNSNLKVVAKMSSPLKVQSGKRSFTELESSKPLSPRADNGDRKSMPLISKPLFSDEDNIGEVIKKVVTELSNEVEMTLPEFSSALEIEENIRDNPFDELSDSLEGCPSKSVSSSKDLEQVSMGDEEESKLIDLNFPAPSEEEKPPPKKFEYPSFSKKTRVKGSDRCYFVGDPIPSDEAQERWGWRYKMKDLQSQRSKRQNLRQNDDDDDEDKMILHVECHFAQANIRDCIFSLGDCAYVQGDGGKKHVGRILEFFRTTDGEMYFRVQWFYFVEDTVIQQVGNFHDKRRLFYSTIMNDNSIDCIISKVHITKITPRAGLKISSILPSDFYYDMEYCLDYSTFRSLSTENPAQSSCLESNSSFNALSATATGTHAAELTLLDIYSGCGGMSTGLTLGAEVSGVNLVTRWAVDCTKPACESLKLNHPETYVRNEAAEDFLELLKEWEKLCKRYRSSNLDNMHAVRSNAAKEEVESDDGDSSEVFEVSTLLDICYGDPSNTGDRGLKFKVSWKGYDSSEDTWEPVEGLSNCEEKIAEFVRNGRSSKILPLPAEVDVICGGPPCQGVSGYNRFRNYESPLEDERNRQIIVFMDIVNYLKPKYVLMENVVDILRFDKGSLGRYALSRLVHMKYQARFGIIAAGCYGLPQFRLRVFVWGALPHETLPQFPLPTHDVILRYWPPPEFERNTVAYDEDQPRDLENALVLQDAISDLPPVQYDETRDEIPYDKPPDTEFQKYIRSFKSGETECSLFDHRPWKVSEDDYIRVCKIPKRKGANFRDLPGVVVGHDNVARRAPNEEIIMLPSGRPLVPDYCFTFEQGRSKRPFGRLSWDETVPTVLTSPNCHSQVLLHPEQDRILTIRECARLQGFPDSFRFCGTVKERYCQVGNAVPVNVSRALGYSLGMAIRKLSDNKPLLTLPHKFSLSSYSQLAAIDASQDSLAL